MRGRRSREKSRRLLGGKVTKKKAEASLDTGLADWLIFGWSAGGIALS
jgi:hypothetical protein